MTEILRARVYHSWLLIRVNTSVTDGRTDGRQPCQ